MKQHSILLLMAVLVATGTSKADFSGYVSTSTEVFFVDFDTGLATSLGPSGIPDIRSLDISPLDGSLYATDDFGQLWKIDTTSGAGTLIGNVDRCTDALSFAPDGQLYAILEFNRLRQINISTAAATTIGPLFSYTGTLTLAINSSGEAIAWDRWTESLFEIDLSDGSTTFVGSVDTDFASFDYGPDDVLYGLIDNQLYRVDPDSLEVEHLLDIGVGYGYRGGLAISSTVVPVPGAVLLGMLGLSVAGIKLRK